MFQGRFYLFALAGLLASALAAADVENGKSLHDDSCISCHLMDDHLALYTREGRKVSSLHSLGGQVSMCTQVLNVDWFPEDERDVVEYLNATYYQFKPTKTE
jgi:cytochrome c5